MSGRIKTLYGQLVRNGYDLGGYEKFNAAMHDSNRRRSLYNQLVANRADLGGYEKFSSVVETAPRTAPSAPQKKSDFVADTINMLRTPSSQYTRPQPSKSAGTFEMPSKYDIYHNMPDAIKRHQTPTPLKPEAVMPSVPSNAAESVWAAADKAESADVREKVDEGWSWRKIMQALSSGASVTGGLGDDNAQALETTSVAHLKTHDLQKLSDQAWAALGTKQQQSIINDTYRYLKEQYPDADDKALVDAARKMARAKSDEQMYNLAVERNMPKSVGEFFLRKAAAASSFGSLSKGYASMMAGTRGDMEAEDTALQKYGAKHKVADIAGSVAGFAVDPLTYASGAVGGAATKVALWTGGKVLSEAAVRKMSQTLGGKLLLGAVGGAANFGTFEAGGEAINQYKWGGTLDVDPETGRYVVGDFSLGKVASQMRHGLTMGGLTGAFGTWLGNVSTKAAQATSSTLGKLGVRTGELGVGLVGEGTIFATPEFFSTYGEYNDVIKSVSDKNSPNYIADDKERSKYIAEIKAQRGERMMDIWQDNLAMIAGFKAQHALKSAGRTISELAASRRGKVGFVERMGRMLDGHPSLALSKEEQTELDKHGYGDLTQMVKEYKAYAQKDGDLPYNKITQLLNDKNVSEAARAKMYYYVTGHSLPMSAVIASNVIDNGDKTYTVQSLGDNGVITSRTYGSRKRADYEKARIDRQAELNGVAMAEQMFDNMDRAERLKAVCTRLAQDKGVSPETLLWLTRKDPKQMTSAEKRWVKEIEDAANEDAPQGENATVRHIKGVIFDEYGVDVDKALRKAADSRTEAEKSAISAYNNELAQAVAERKNAISQGETTDAYRRGYEADTQGMRDAYVAQMYEPSEDNAETLKGVEAQITESAKYQAALERDELKQMTHKDGSTHLATLKEKDKDGNGKQVYIVDGDIVMKEDGSGIDADASSNSVIIYDPATGEKKMVSPTAVDGIESLGEVKTAEQREAEINAQMQDAIQRSKDWLEGNVTDPVGMQIQLGDGRIATIEAMHEDGKSAIATLPDGTQFLVSKDVLQRIVNNGHYADYKARRDAEASKREAEQGSESAPETATEGGQPLTEEVAPKEEERREYAQGDEFEVVVDGQKMHAEIVSPKDADGRFVVNVDDGESMRTLYVTPEELSAMEYREDPLANAEETRLASEETSTKDLERGAQPTEEHTPTALERIPRDEKGNARFHDVDTETAWDGLVEMSGNEETAHKVAEASLANAEKKLKAAKALKEKGETPEELLRSIKENEAAVAEAQRVVAAWKAIVGEESRREEAAKAEAERKAAEERERAEAEEKRIAEEKAEAERKAQEERERAEEERDRIEAELDAQKADEEARLEAERKAEEEAVEKDAELKEDKKKPQLKDVVKAIYEKGKSAASRLYKMAFFDVAKTPDFMKKLGLTGDRFTIKYGVLSRHAGKDDSHSLTEKQWEELPDALQKPFAITRFGGKDKGYRLYTTMKNENGETIVVGVDVKNVGRDMEVNAISTIFGRRGDAKKTQKEDVLYTAENITPEQRSLLGQPNSDQYTGVRERNVSTDKGSEKAEKKQEKQSVFDKAKEIADKEEKKRKAEAEDDSALGQATRAVGKKKKVNLFKYTASKIISYPALRGVHYANGYAYASDGYILFKEKADYPKEWEGTTRDKDGNLIDGKYPDTEKAIHRLVHIPDKEAVSLPSKEVLDFAIAASKKLKGEAIPVAIDGLFFNAVNLKKFLEAVASKGMDKIVYRHPMLYATNGKDEIVMMPTVNTLEGALDIADKMESVGLPKEQIDAWKAHIEAADKKMSLEDFKKAVENAKKEGVRHTEAEKPKEQPLTEAERKDAEEVAGALGYRVEWVDTMEENGTIDADKKVIRIAKDAENPLVQVLGHEVAHGVRRMIGGKFRALQKAAKEVVGEKEWNERIGKKRGLNAYAEGKLAEEVTCDIVGEALNDKEALKRLAESLRGEKGILARLRDAVARMVEYFKNRGDKEGVRRMKAADKLLAEFESALKEGVAPEQVKPEGVDRSVRESGDEPENKRRKDFAERFGVDESYVSDYANGMAQKNTGKAAIARRSMERQIYLADAGKTSKLSDIAKSLKSFKAALKEAFGDLDALIDEYRNMFEEERNMMEAARKKAEEEAAARKRHLDELSLLTEGQIDSRYAEALEKGDETEAREMLDEVARRKGYGDENNEYRMQHRAPSNPGYESDEARRNDIENGPDVNLEDIALGYNRQPDDYFTNPRGYLNDTPHGRESTDAVANALSSIRQGGRDVTVKVYRAVPTTMKEGKLRNGDWVSLSRRYAEMHGNHALNGKYRIMEDEVPAKDIWWDGNDVNEFGYDNGEDYKYKNVKNNRKSDDLVTRDDKGNVIPPSKRFNQRKADERYSRRESKALTAEERELRDNLVERMRKGGLDVVTDSEEMQRVIDTENERTRMTGAGSVREHRVYHGSGADFDAFDHSHMGEGEGAQAYGWGTYVTEVEGIGKTYANATAHNYNNALRPLERKKDSILTSLRINGSELDKARAGLRNAVRFKTKENYEEFLRRREEIEEKYGKHSTQYDDYLWNSPYAAAVRAIEHYENEIKERETELHSLQKDLEETRKQIENIEKEFPHHLYTVEIPDDNGGNYLDWNGHPAESLLKDVGSFLEGEGFERVQDNPARYEKGESTVVLNPNATGADLYAELQEALGGDKKASQALAELGYTGIKYPADNMRGGRKDGAKNYVIFNENDAKITAHTRFLRTAGGEVYGLVKDGRIYLDPKVATAETAVHEYTHLWGDMLRRKDSEQWSHTVKELKNSVLWEEVKELYPELKTDDEIADEVLSTFSGRRGAERLREEARKVADGEGGVFTKAKAIETLERVKEAIARFWEGVARMFGINRYRSAEELADMAMRDLLDSKNPMKDESGMRKRGEVGDEGVKSLKGEEAMVALDNIFEDKKTENMPQKVSSLVKFMELFRKPVRTFLGEVVNVKEEVYNKIIREKRTSISGAVLPTLENADFAIRDTDGSTLYIKRFKSENNDNVYNIAVVNKYGEVEDYVSSVHIKSDNNLRNKITKGAELLLPQERITDGTMSRNNSTPDAKVANYSETAKPRFSRKPGESIFDYASRVSDSVDRSVRERVSARDEYEKKVKSKGFQTKEALQNSMLGLQEFMFAIDHASGNKRYIEDIPDFENPILGENRLSSVNKEEMHQVAKTQFKPLMSAVAKLSGNGKESGELYDYMFAKHGLERDAVMRQREAQKEFDKYQKANPKGTKTIGDFVASLEGKDYAGLTALTAEDGRVKSIQSQIDAIDEQMKATDDQLLLRNLGGQKKRLKVDLLNAARDAADDIRKAFESNPSHDRSDINELWKRVNEVNGNTLRKLYESGMLTKEAYNDINSMYTHYIPMRGFAQTTSADAYAYLTHSDSAFNAPIKTAKGRSSKADNPIAYMQAMAESAIMQGNRNVLVKQKMLNFVRNHPSDLASVSDVWLQYDSVADEWKPVFPDNIGANDSASVVAKKMEAFEDKMKQMAENHPDLVKRSNEAPDIPYKVVEKGQLNEHQVLVKQNGKSYIITVNGSPRAAQAANGLTNPDTDLTGAVGKVFEGAEALNRQLSSFYTTLNPDFIGSNYVRDALYSNTMVYVKEGAKYGGSFNLNFAKYNPGKMTNLYARYNKGNLDTSNETHRLFLEFMQNGGETGFVNLKQIEKRKSEIAKAIKREGKISAAQIWGGASDAIDFANRAVENSARFAAYVTSRRSGRSVGRSVYDAKEISVNFNRKGSGSKFMGAEGQTKAGNAAAFVSGAGRGLYIFWNAGLQGLTNFSRQIGRHPGRALTLASLLFGFGALMSYLGSNDDDDENNYFNLPKYIRRSNVCYKIGDLFVTIPLPVEYRAFYGLGELASSTLAGKESGTTKDIAKEAVSQISQLFPIDFAEGGGGLHALIPSAVKPIVEAETNTAWTGLPIYKDNDFNKNMPEYTKVYKTANGYLVEIARALNDATGGNKYKKGFIDINPAKMEYVLKGMLGGAFSFPDKLVKTTETILGEREFDWRNTPFANRFVKNADERTEYKALNEQYFKLKDEMDVVKQQLKGFEKEADAGNEKYEKALLQLEDSKDYERLELFKDYEKEFKGLNDELKELRMSPDYDKAEEKELQKEIAELQRQLIGEMREIKK